MTPFTPVQVHAITLQDRNLLLNAGAGSGKTRVLVERYLHLLETHPDWALNSVVAITFTQKAAAEMRDRVRQTLSKRYEDAQNDPIAAARWAIYLGAMDSARIDTIHGLCASILRANAAEAGIDPHFVVMDEVAAGILLDDVIDDTLWAAAVRDGLALFETYESKVIRDVLESMASASHTLAPLPADPMAAWAALWERDVSAGVRALQGESAFWEIVSWQPDDGYPLASDKLADVWFSCRDCLSTLSSAYPDSADANALYQTLVALTEIKVNRGAAAGWGNKETVALAKEVLTAVCERAKALIKQIGERPGAHDETAARLLPLWDALVRRVQTAYAEAKRARASLDFDDLEILTRNLLVTYPHVRDRYRDREFHHVLVDEFQDTNDVQWEIVQALADTTQPGRVFVVGDPKQSIYGFRGADVRVFDQVRAAFAASAHGLESNMAESFRTHRPLVEMFNALFAHVLVRDETSAVSGYQVRFEPMSAFRTHAPTANPPLEFVLLDTDQLPKNEADVEAGRVWEADVLAARLREIVEVEQRLIYDRDARMTRPVCYGDIALLFQVMSNAELYESALKTAGLPYVTIAGRGYYDRQEVWDVLNLLRVLHHPADDLALASALRSPMFGLSDEALLTLRLQTDAADQPLSLWAALAQSADPNSETMGDEQPSMRAASDMLRDLRAMAGRVSVAELLRTAFERTGYPAILTGLPDGARRRGNLEKLLAIAEQSGKTTLSAFSQYVSDLTQSEVREGEAVIDSADAITLMTVHKSKGLEFPLVVLVDASRSGRGNTDYPMLIEDAEIGLACRVYDAVENKFVSSYAYQRAMTRRQQREEAEWRRLLYVAITRAQDAVIVSGQVSTDKEGALKSYGWMKWMIDAFALDPSITYGETRVYAWGDALFHVPEPPSRTRARKATIMREWSITPIPDAPAPPLIAPVVVEQDAPARSMTATQIADLGGAQFAYSVEDRSVFRARWRRAILHDTDGTRIERLIDSTDRAKQRKIGEIVHRVLQICDPESDRTRLKTLIDSFAWEEGIVSDDERLKWVNEVVSQLVNVAQSDVQAWIRSAKNVYRELPFVFKTEKRIIHGVMDVLIERDTGDWAVIDYKTNSLGRTPADAELRTHARRFTLQVGVYAAAVRELIGETPRAYIHYIRHKKTVEIAYEQWSSALDSLEDHIGDLLRDDA